MANFRERDERWDERSNYNGSLAEWLGLGKGWPILSKGKQKCSGVYTNIDLVIFVGGWGGLGYLRSWLIDVILEWVTVGFLSDLK